VINLFHDIPFTKPNFYFDINGKKFLNNVDALIEASKFSNPRIEFVLDYDVYRNRNLWKTEPSLNIKDYFRSYAKIISEKYEDITIHYSGGTDSQTILDAFIDAGVRNVKLWYRSSPGFEDFGPRIKVFEDTRKSLIEKYSEKLKQLNYTIVGMDSQFSFKAGDAAEWRLALENFIGDYDFVKNCNESIKHYHSKHKTVSLIKKNSCMIWGLEKPYMVLKNGIWYWVTFSNRWFQYDMPSSNEYDTIFFFFNDDVPEIPIKLTWLKIDALEKILKTYINITNSEAEMLCKDFQSFSSSYYTFINESMGYKALNLSLNGTYWRASQDYTAGKNHLYAKREKSGINRETKYFYEENVLGKVNSAYLKGDDTLVSLSSTLIPIRKANLEFKE
jgi:hypothetical protein